MLNDRGTQGPQNTRIKKEINYTESSYQNIYKISDMITCRYISDLLLRKKLPQNLTPKTYIISWFPWVRSSSAGWCWLRVSQKATFKVTARNAIIWKLDNKKVSVISICYKVTSTAILWVLPTFLTKGNDKFWFRVERDVIFPRQVY